MYIKLEIELPSYPIGPLSVSCPKCEAGPGRACGYSSVADERWVEYGGYHGSRKNAHRGAIEMYNRFSKAVRAHRMVADV